MIATYSTCHLQYLYCLFTDVLGCHLHTLQICDVTMVASIASGVLETADGQLEADSDHCKHWQTAAPLSSRNQQHTTDIIISGEHPGHLAESLDRR